MDVRDLDRETRDLLNIVLSEVVDMESVSQSLEQSTLSEFTDDRKQELILNAERFLQNLIDSL